MRKLRNDELVRLDVDGFKQASKTPIILVLDNVRSLNNIGSVFRTADAFLVEKIYLCGITARPPHKDMHKTALGATETVAWEYVENIQELLKRMNRNTHKIIAIEQAEKATYLDTFLPDDRRKQVFIFGNEVKGVQQDVVSICEEVLEIPQFGTKHSLNISVSVGVVVWDCWGKLKNKKPGQ